MMNRECVKSRAHLALTTSANTTSSVVTLHPQLPLASAMARPREHPQSRIAASGDPRRCEAEIPSQTDEGDNGVGVQCSRSSERRFAGEKINGETPSSVPKLFQPVRL
ncbi:hypothetical protein GA0061093_13422 [Rhodococcus qingshengii]|nr:hypothetical protein GA0061093_13422 [Rhodococcus qingshengii]